MLQSYFKVAWRNLWKNKFLSAIKIAGLSIGLAVCLLIFLYSKDELSFDRFHDHGRNIWRVVQEMHISNQPPAKLSITQAPLGDAFAAEIPEVKARTRVVEMSVTVKKENEVFLENPVSVDDDFFSVFSFDLLEGNPSTALKDIHSIVLTESTAKKYFGSTTAMGKTMQVKTRDEFENFTVTGIAADPPRNSTVRFTMLVPFSFYAKGLSRKSWIGGSLNTFLLLEAKADRTMVTKKMQRIFDNNTREQIAEAEKEQKIKAEITLGLQPMWDIHLNKELGAENGLAEVSSPAYSFVLSSIAVFILLMACINFINLSIGQSLKRSREIGIRKVVGGKRQQLIVQFLAESFLVSLFAFAAAIVLATAILPLFNELSGKKLSLAYLADGWLYAGWFVLLLITAVVAGLYPAVILSGFQPLKVLTGRNKLMGKSYFARSLVVFQFTLAIFLIIGTIAVYTQLHFLFNHDLGYESNNLVKIDLPFSDNNDRLTDRFKNELRNKPGIVNIATRNKGRWGSGVWADDKQINIDLNSIDAAYFPVFKIPFKTGRNFSPAFPGDTIQSAIVNETFVQQAGWPIGSAVGKTIRMMEEERTLTIIGVINDYNYRSLKSKIEAQVFMLGPAKQYGQLWIKISDKDVPATLAQLSVTFQKLSPLYPYSYDFMDSINEREYAEEANWKQVISVSAILFIFIACIGLLGLVMLSIEQRTKELGIRKVLGAAASSIFLLVSKEFLFLVGIALLVAIPAGYYAISRWLEEFPYHTAIHWWMFGLAGATVIALALLTIIFHAFKAAAENPVKSLRTE